ncbi:MAG TPA: 50S ribosomal protein L17 [Acidobacteriota bacterium]|nr:50S ribosomal protein L17 [Acidobacteriota bacterium]
MRHRNRRGKLGKKSEHRNMMLRNMATSLFDKERIKTTLPKAKALRPYAEKLITLARKNDLPARRLTLAQIQDKKVVKKLFDDIAKRYKDDAKGGYTRIVAYRSRWGDGADLAFIELNRAILPDKVQEEADRKKKKKPAAKEESDSEKSK